MRGVAWAAGVTLATFVGLAATARLRADAKLPAPAADAAFELALGGPTGVIAVLNPVNCSISSEDVAAINAVAAVPGMRVTVLLLAVALTDSVLKQIRTDFSFSAAVHLASATQFDPTRFPALFRQPFVAVLKRGQLRHAAWGEAIKSLSSWLPVIAGLRRDDQLTSAESST